MSGLGQSVRSTEAKPAAVPSSRRRALLALLPSDQQIVARINLSFSDLPVRPVALANKSS